eukprot:TRINITY_DN4525_c0_g1_i1.p1 TRINITY_DN4525_c0_g1~~TRINITY_DN4525_c0_g1_i1.p1  ORF type:complete len:707 (-),score=261.05 TRINITY_DN4525_c0_g1_i1:216-2336(-)
MVIGSFHPMGALYDQAVSISKARQASLDLMAGLAAFDVGVVSVGDILRSGTELDDRHKLEKFAMQAITYETNASHLTPQEASYLSKEYKERAVKRMDTADLIDAIITRPRLTLEKSALNTPLTTTAYNFNPLSNLVFTRDQQIVTAAGVVLAQLHSKQRAPEVDLIRFCLEKLGIPVLGQIPLPGTLEGGDFLPAGKELCFIGLGIRTNTKAVTHMLQNKWFGTQRVAMVKDLLDRRQSRMHLDCVFNIVSDNIAVLAASVAGENSRAFRLVDEFTLIDGEYRMTQENVEFAKYLQSVGYHILYLTDRMHEHFGCNFINCGNGRLITTDVETADLITKCSKFSGTVNNVDYSEITNLYGALHCSTQVWRHTRPDRRSTLPAPEDAIHLVTQLNTPPSAALPTGRQTTNSVLIVAPTYFGQNPESMQDNTFMQTNASKALTALEMIAAACHCFARLYEALKKNGVHFKMWHHEGYHGTPDAVFPNNWFSTHSDTGTLVLYPMKNPSRRRERRPSIVNFLKTIYPNVVDLTYYELDDLEATKALEGTGALVLDRIHKVAFCALSQRADADVLAEWCKVMSYTAVTFKTVKEIYHTNVMMSIGRSLAIVCAESIVPQDRNRVIAELRRCGKHVVPVTEAQMGAFLCNCIEVRNDKDERLLFMSSQAYRSMTEQQMYDVLHHVDRIVDVDYESIETIAGGGVRCSIAELF